MKTKMLLASIGLTIFSLHVHAQTNSESAFAKSYSFEYDLEYDKAIDALLSQDDESYEVNLRLGWLYYLDKEYTKAQTHYKKAISIEQGSVEARFGLALPMVALGNMSSVLATYLEILKIDPNNSVANYRTAAIYFTKKDYPNALSYVSKVIKMYPFDYDSNLLAGKIMINQNKNAEAKKYLTKALEYNPQSVEVKHELKKLL